MSTTEQELPGPVLEYLREHNTLTLATASGSGIPRAATFLYVNEGPSLYFWSKGSTISARHVQQNPMVAFTVDEYANDLTQTRGVQGIGAVLDDSRRRPRSRGWPTCSARSSRRWRPARR